MKPLKLLPIAVTLLLAQNASAQTRRYVNIGAGGTHTGTSWTTAFNDLQIAINTAAAGDTLFVAKGLYVPTTIAGTGTVRDKTFLLKDRVSIYGGFAGTEAQLADRDIDLVLTTNASILSGNIGAADSLDNCYHVLTAINVSAKTSIDGFIVQDGNANGNTDNMIGTTTVSRNMGGGFYNENSAMSLQNLLVQHNSSLLGGGGFYNHNSPVSITESELSFNYTNGVSPLGNGGGAIYNVNSNTAISFTVFTENSALNATGGGAMRNENSKVFLDNTYFANNNAEDGDGGGAVYNAAGSNGLFSNTYFYLNTTTNQAGAMYNDNSSPSLVNAEFYENYGDAGTGAMENDGGSNAILTDVYFSGNHTPGNGGAIQNWKSSPVLTRVEFAENAAGLDGGAIYNYNTCSPTLTACWFYYNTAGGNGGGFYNMRGSNPILTNCLIIRNTAVSDGGGIYTMAKDAGGTEPSSPVFTNVTIANNIAGNSGGGGYADGYGAPRLRNSIISGNVAAVVADIDAPPSIAATAVFKSIVGDLYFTTGSSAPVTLLSDIFVDTLLDDYRPAAFSGAINMGDSNYFSSTATPDLSLITSDIQGADRVMGSNIDLGAIEVCTDTLKGSITMTVSPGKTVTAGTIVTFAAIAVNGGSFPAYQWRNNGVEILGFSAPVYTATAGIDFISGDKITVTLFPDLYGPCESYDTAVTAPAVMFITMGIAGIEHQKSVSVYPNPNNGTFTLQTEFSNGKEYSINILDLTGRTVYTEKFSGNGTAKSISIGNKIPAGTYMLSLENDDMPKQVVRFVIQ